MNSLENYRRRGYQLALNFDYLAQALSFEYTPEESEAFDLIASNYKQQRQFLIVSFHAL